jgi:tetratricopeptide (TPR) repeat protein
MMQGKFAEAEPLQRDVVERFRRVMGEDYPDTLVAIGNMGALLRELGKLAEAEVYAADAVQRSRRVMGADHPNTISALDNLGSLLRRQGKLEEAEPVASEAMERARRVLGDEHPQTLIYLANYITVLRTGGKLDQALPLAAELYRRCESSPLPPQRKGTYSSAYGLLLVKMGKYSDAEQPLLRAYEHLQSASRNADPQTREVIEGLIHLLDQTNRPREAAEWRSRLDALGVSTPPATAPAIQN